MLKNMRLLGLDVGEKTIGCALADDTGIVVSPAKPIQRQNGSMALGQLRRIIKKNNVKGIIIGLPYNMDGSKGERFRKVKGYAGKLKKHFKELFFDFQDERLSTWSVQEKYKKLKLKKKENDKINIDSFAAMEILEDYLK